jgi:hypothetical protein
MRLLMQAGYAFAEAVRCSAVNGGKLIGGAGGLLSVGRAASFAVHAAGPDEALLRGGAVKAVFVNGMAVLRD